jgi:hypothetical protein
MMGNMTAIILFVLVGLITANFSKNMVLVLAVPLVVTSSYVGGMFIKEGLENMSKDKKDSDAKAASTGVTDKSTDVPADTDIEKAKQQLDSKEKKPIVTGEPPVGHDAKMTPQKNEKKGSYVDHAATLNEGYESLSKMLDGSAIQNLSNDTKKLAAHQKSLWEAMNNMGPIFENAKNMLDSIDMEKLGSMSKLAQSLGVQKA